MTATHAKEIDHSPPLLATCGRQRAAALQRRHVRRLGEGAVFLRVQLEGQVALRRSLRRQQHKLPHLPLPTGTATPRPGRPSAASNSGKTTTVYVSWNGATGVKRWRVLAGASSSSLKAATTARRTGFETAIKISRQSHVRVQALAASGHVLGISAVTASR